MNGDGAHRLRVAIVDDSVDVRELLRLTLELDGRFELVGQAADGLAAIDLARASTPDLMLLDRQMPRLGGMEALPLIRAASPHTSVILYTAYDEEGTHQAAVAAGALDVLIKSTVGQAFVDELSTVLLRNWSNAADDVEVSMGPVSSTSALAAIEAAERILAAVRTHPHLCDESIPEAFYETLAAFLSRWRVMAKGNEQFSLRVRLPNDRLQEIVVAWVAVAGIPAERLRSVGVEADLGPGDEFFQAISAAVAQALDRQATTRSLAERLRHRRSD